eukprot:549633-Amphidinium_carterae.1
MVSAVVSVGRWGGAFKVEECGPKVCLRYTCPVLHHSCYYMFLNLNIKQKRTSKDKFAAAESILVKEYR